jgi:hypothetical protein
MSPRKLTGYTLLAVSCLAFGVLPIIPFLSLEGEQKLTWGGGVFVFAEVTWWLSMPLLGPEIIEFTKKWWNEIKCYVRGGPGDNTVDKADKED